MARNSIRRRELLALPAGAPPRQRGERDGRPTRGARAEARAPARRANPALAGAALMSNFSVTVVAAQAVIPANKALAAGLSMGFAGGLGALAVILVGGLADVAGVPAAIHLLFLLPLVAGLPGLLMQNRTPDRGRRMTPPVGRTIAG